ncbi:hypothetical protein EDD18DRAFT_1121130 [Armillaria luteobubalina]|uniref:Uncharacterized protein n=1 Tax=Armillaria luteobubalina TaxID=153913 RepID=A0AA39QMX8_9AGAR|nr:hypothetical protein EDD18DRAFT_1121130 [Armillaria luteobubalina]
MPAVAFLSSLSCFPLLTHSSAPHLFLPFSDTQWFLVMIYVDIKPIGIRHCRVLQTADPNIHLNSNSSNWTSFDLIPGWNRTFFWQRLIVALVLTLLFYLMPTSASLLIEHPTSSFLRYACYGTVSYIGRSFISATSGVTSSWLYDIVVTRSRVPE